MRAFMPEYRPSEQVPRRLNFTIIGILALLLMILPLSACGKKPNQLDPPPGAQDNAFPKIYPDPATDPKP